MKDWITFFLTWIWLTVSGFQTNCPCVMNFTVISHFKFENHILLRIVVFLSWSMCDIISLCPCQILICFYMLFKIECLSVIKIFYMSLSRKEDNAMSCNSGFRPVLIYFTCYATPLNGFCHKLMYSFWDLCSLYVTEVCTVRLYLTKIFFPGFQKRIHNLCVVVVPSIRWHLALVHLSFKQEWWSRVMMIQDQVRKWLMVW